MKVKPCSSFWGLSCACDVLEWEARFTMHRACMNKSIYDRKKMKKTTERILTQISPQESNADQVLRQKGVSAGEANSILSDELKQGRLIKHTKLLERES